MLGSGGRFACNLGAPVGSERTRPTVHEYMLAYAVIDHDFVFTPGRRPQRREQITDQLRDSGFELREEKVEFPGSAEETLAWMRIPIFTEHWSGLTYEQRMDSLEKPGDGWNRPRSSRTAGWISRQ